jgi:tetratricopeptide (TPR) repeat protein
MRDIVPPMAVPTPARTAFDLGRPGEGERFPARSDFVVLTTPTWSLRVEGRRLAIVLSRAPLPGGAELADLVVDLPHVSFPFDFRDGLERFRHQRGQAEELTLRVEARVLLDWLNQASGGAIHGTAQDDQLVLSGRTEAGARWTTRARLVPANVDEGDGEGEPLLQVSLHGMRVYGATTEPWPLFAERVLNLLPRELVVDRTLTTARVRCVRTALAWALSGLGWKLPDVSRLEARGVELREGRFIARFALAGREGRDGRNYRELHDLVMDADGSWGDGVRTAFERFVEDLELKRHHGQVDRLLAEGQLREALAEIYHAMEGPPRPGFLAERLIGIAATQPILHDEGERICRALLELSPGYEPALVGLAAIALGRGRPEEAAVQLERLLGVLTAPQDREDAIAADLTLATILRDFAPDESRAALERVLVRSPDHEEALAELIALTESEGDARLALPLYKRLLFSARSKQRTRDAGLRLARFALARNEPEDARVLLKVVLESTPDDLEAQVALAEVETREGQALEALRILEDALRRIPLSDATRLVKVIVLLSRLLLDVIADPARARRVLWRAGDLARLEGPDAIELATLAMRAREPALALRFCDLVPGDAAVWTDAQAIRAEALVARGDARQALQALLGVLSREPDHAGALSLLEVAAPEPAQREWLVHQLYDSARRVSSGEPRAQILHRVARLYESLGLAWDALQPLEEAIMEAPQSDGFEARAARLMALQQEFGLWTEYLRTGAQRVVRMRAQGLVDESAIGKRVVLLTALGRAALDEVGDAAHARTSLEEAARLSPRALEAQELLARALEAELRDAAPELTPALVQGLVGAFTRLIALRPDAAAQDDARLRLAELQLDRLGAVGPARATLTRLSEGCPRDGRVRRLLGRVGLGPVEPEVKAPPEPRPSSGKERWAAALEAADRGDEALARVLLETVLRDEPSHVPARELLALLPPNAAYRPAASEPRGRTGAEPSEVFTPDRMGSELEALLPPNATDRSVAFAPSSVEPLHEPRRPEFTPRSDMAGSSPASRLAAGAPNTAVTAMPPTSSPSRLEPTPTTSARGSTPPSEPPTDATGPIAARQVNGASPDITRGESQRVERGLTDGTASKSNMTNSQQSAQFVTSSTQNEDAERPVAPIPSGAMAQIDARVAESDAIDHLLSEATAAYFGDDLPLARERLEAILALDADVVPALELLQEILQAMGEHRARAETLERLVERVFDATTSASYLKSLGEALTLADEAGRARTAFTRYLRLRPLDDGIFRRLIAELEPDDSEAAHLAELWEARADALEDADASPNTVVRALLSAARAHFRARAFKAAAYACERANALAAEPDPEVLELLLRADLATGGEDAMRRVRETAGRLLPLLLPGPDREWIEGLAGH